MVAVDSSKPTLVADVVKLKRKVTPRDMHSAGNDNRKSGPRKVPHHFL